jgi:hypothetical protein
MHDSGASRRGARTCVCNWRSCERRDHATHFSPAFQVKGGLRTMPPATANGLIAGLVRACGLPAESETEVDPQSIAGAIVNVRFSVLPGNPQPQPIAFEPLRKEETHAQ